MNHIARVVLVMLIVLTLLLTACSSSATPTDTPTSPDVPASPNVPTPAPTDSPPALTATTTRMLSAPTASPVAPAASATLADGPWLLISTDEGFWAVNPDGSGLTQLPISSAPHADVVPRGGRVAFITTTGPQNLGLALSLLSLPAGDVRSLAPLTSSATEPKSLVTQGENAYRAIIEGNSLAWSPDESQLAFVGAADGPTSDLYVYSLADERITRLTDGPSQAIRPSWSPDGTYIVHTGVSSLGSGAGYSMEGVWAARADDSGVETLYPIPSGSGDEVLVAWTSATAFLVYTWKMGDGPSDLRTVDVETKELALLWGDRFTDVVLDPASGNLLLAMNEYAADANPGRGKGLFLIQPGQDASWLAEVDVRQMVWSPKAGLFFVQGDNGVWAITPDGQVEELPAPVVALPSVSPNGRRWAFGETDFRGQPGLWVGDLKQEPRQVFSGSANHLAWGPEGECLLFFGADGLHAAHSPDFAPVLVGEGLHARSTVWVWPDGD